MKLEKWNELQKLFDEYLELVVAGGHFKTSDGMIELNYHYNCWSNTEYWYLSHDGYVNYFNFEADTPDGVINKGIEKLKRLIKEEKEFLKKREEDEEWFLKNLF